MVKLAQSPPVTSEPIIYGMVRFQSADLMRIRTSAMIHVKDLSETLRSLHQQDLIRSQPLSIELVRSCLKSISYYRKRSVYAWSAFDIEPDSHIDFLLFTQMVDFVDIFLIESQLFRYFKAMNIEGSMDLSGFETFLMAYDVLGFASEDIFLLDLYDTFKIEQTPDFLEFFTNKEGLDYSGYVECMHLPSVEGIAVNLFECKFKYFNATQNPIDDGNVVKALEAISSLNKFERPCISGSICKLFWCASKISKLLSWIYLRI